MNSGIKTVHVRRSKGVLIVQGDGQTPRGKRFIKKTAPLKCKHERDPAFKEELAEAVEKLLSETGSNN